MCRLLFLLDAHGFEFISYFFFYLTFYLFRQKANIKFCVLLQRATISNRKKTKKKHVFRATKARNKEQAIGNWNKNVEKYKQRRWSKKKIEMEKNCCRKYSIAAAAAAAKSTEQRSKWQSLTKWKKNTHEATENYFIDFVSFLFCIIFSLSLSHCSFTSLSVHI